ncbi:FMN-binding negative transcriptional regulator [Mangrovicoccus algicola]|uniref:FMN-binding negative transcriptional regulator n=1 Tax=Mangrovicoccus algicola TaxID=2771008 RepID=UPI002ED98350
MPCRGGWTDRRRGSGRRGGDALVSPRWPPGKAAHHRQVPGWNGIGAHARGRVAIRDGGSRFSGGNLLACASQMSKESPR